jgi:hypothetical protein
MKIDETSFNQQWAWGKTQEEFVNEFKDMDHIFPDAPDKVAKLKEAHTILQQGKPADFKAPKTSLVKDLANAPASGAKPAELGKTS